MTIKLRYKLIAVALLWTWFFGMAKGCGKHLSPSGPTALPKGDTEQVLIDPIKHTITIITKKGKTVETLPDRPSTFDINQNGTVKVTAKQFGLEHHVFAGAVFSDSARLGLGMDGVYFKKLDLGVGLADQFSGHTPIVFGKLSYNVYGALQAGVVYGSNKYIGLGLTARLF